MTETLQFRIGDRVIGPGQPTYIIAEMSANHAQDLDRAHAIVDAAAQAGADALKLQTYTADTLTIDSIKEPFRIRGGTNWDGQTLYDLYAGACMPWDWQPDLKAHAEDLGMDCFSTPVDSTSLAFLETLGTPVHKISSFEIVDHPLLKDVAKTGKPMIMSTGMATIGEIEEAVRVVREAGNEQLILLKCTSAYPAPPEEMDLATIPHLSETFSVPAGLSDHTLGIEAPVAAVALGACVIEKHLTLDRQVETPDSKFSLTPEEFGAMVDAVRNVENAIGQVRYGPKDQESRSQVFRRSLFVVEDVAEGEAFTTENVRSIRPGDGLAPKYLPQILGRTAAVAVGSGTALDWWMVSVERTGPNGPRDCGD